MTEAVKDSEISSSDNLSISSEKKIDTISVDEGKETDSCPDSEIEKKDEVSDGDVTEDEEENVSSGVVKSFDPSNDLWEKSYLGNSSSLKSLIYDVDEVTLKILDQLLIPHAVSYINVSGIKDGFKVIKNMNVRGAPLIATVALLSIAVELEKPDYDSLNMEKFVLFIKESCAFLLNSRPTAINLRNGLREIVELVDRCVSEGENEVDEIRHKIQIAAYNFYTREWEENDELLKQATICVEANKEPGHKFTVMTICNTGALATSSLGTALGVIRKLHERNHLEMVYCLETRPYNQGSRLTAFELTQESIPFTLITDSMAAWAMRTKKIDVILVGADQVALNGDTANKIGTYMLSILGASHNIPFYVVVPISSINKDIKTGKKIKIEERPAIEMLSFNGLLTAPTTTNVWNPAFDVTPAKFITGILTEKGCFRPNELGRSILKL
uniref:Methylthioribose-1-phosphate isomerase n=1 Tax=Strongyloides venezuelensis TaxID=75913 RepID=A0A0K0F0A8_STRVS